mmetsp:Transcript_11616/g.21023  ORF Transcript_11616/g.21023 Transcript_11616/m.21023 type:complete len:478 (-) Transcript_11616:1366-2799(-)|eukprot:CAMPEP_0182445622 /NCGR_PEP_ID=MMETSP1172-20130603/3690_1 /TAXON_ID=708627 /ORGANISM="Timspurckia oligopyrenoides, Strain CCMP3278" /LENGTH=477 /DNA_ID=CAMNT_0024641429 /DNA_START=256 /DNA_END=1689 /DNA_ORIENTATION=-
MSQFCDEERMQSSTERSSCVVLEVELPSSLLKRSISEISYSGSSGSNSESNEVDVFQTPRRDDQSREAFEDARNRKKHPQRLRRKQIVHSQTLTPRASALRDSELIKSDAKATDCQSPKGRNVSLAGSRHVSVEHLANEKHLKSSPIEKRDSEETTRRGTSGPASSNTNAKSSLPLARALGMSLRSLCLKVEAREKTTMDFYPSWCESFDLFYTPPVERQRSASNGDRLRHNGPDEASALLTELRRLLKYSRCSVSAYAVALIYMRRLARSTRTNSPSSGNSLCSVAAAGVHNDVDHSSCEHGPSDAHDDEKAFQFCENRTPKVTIRTRFAWKLYLTCVMLAAKFLDDRVHTNDYFALIGDISNSTINSMELVVLNALEFRLAVSSAEYKAVERELALAALAQSAASNARNANGSGSGGSQASSSAGASSSRPINSRIQPGHLASVANGALFPPFSRPASIAASSSLNASAGSHSEQ